MSLCVTVCDRVSVVCATQGDTAKAGRLGFVAGLIPQEKLNGFERLLFRWVGVSCEGVEWLGFGWGLVDEVWACGGVGRLSAEFRSVRKQCVCVCVLPRLAPPAVAAIINPWIRATRGNMFLRQTPVGSVKDPATGELQEKHVFVVFYAGERARTKVLKV